MYVWTAGVYLMSNSYIVVISMCGAVLVCYGFKMIPQNAIIMGVYVIYVVNICPRSVQQRVDTNAHLISDSLCACALL